MLHLRSAMTLEQVAGKYGLSMAAVHAAMAYYYDHRSTIDAEIDAEADAIEHASSGSISRVQARRGPVTRG
jgi:multidrug resistance efflux pump